MSLHLCQAQPPSRRPQGALPFNCALCKVLAEAEHDELAPILAAVRSPFRWVLCNNLFDP